MRGGRSFLILLVLALGIGGYAYFVESKKDLTTPQTKRDKVFTLESNKIEEIEVKATSGEVTTIKKHDTTWQITAPEAVDADSTEITSLASTLESLETQKVIDEHPATTTQFGLDPPRYTVGARLFGETSMHRLKIGNKTPNGSDLYAQIDGQPAVILISAYVEDSLNKTPFDLREKSVLKFAHDGVESLKIEATGDPSVSLVKKGTDWRLTAPVTAKADFSAVDAIITRIDQARMKALVAPDVAKASKDDAKKYGFDKPQAVVTIGVGSTRATLAVGAKNDDSTVYARDLSRPLVFTIETAVLTDLKKKADDLRPKDLFEFRSFSATAVDVTYGGTTYSFVKQPLPPAQPSPTPGAMPPEEVWKQTKPTPKDVNLTAITDLLTNVSNLRADKFVDKPLTTGEEFVVTAKFGDSAAPREEKVTFKKSGTVVQAIRAGEPGAAVVSTADFDKALAGFKELAGIK